MSGLRPAYRGDRLVTVIWGGGDTGEWAKTGKQRLRLKWEVLQCPQELKCAHLAGTGRGRLRPQSAAAGQGQVMEPEADDDGGAGTHTLRNTSS